MVAPDVANPKTPSSKDIKAANEILFNAINLADADQLRWVLEKLILKNGEQALKWVEEQMLVPEKAVKPWKDGDDDLGKRLRFDWKAEDETDEDEGFGGYMGNMPGTWEPVNDKADSTGANGEPNAANPLKRKASTRLADVIPRTKRPRFATCVNCEEGFDTTSNTGAQCVWHGGCMDIDESWVDWDMVDGGMKNTEENQRLFPAGFFWTCCKKDGRKGGCKVGRHKENENRWARARVPVVLQRID